MPDDSNTTDPKKDAAATQDAAVVDDAKSTSSTSTDTTPDDDVQALKNAKTQISGGTEEILANVAHKIINSRNVLVALSSDPSVDEMAAAIGVSLYLDKMGKRATAIYSGSTPNALEFLKPGETFESSVDTLQDFVIALNKEKADHLRYKLDGDFVKIYITPYKTRISEEDLEFSYGDFNVDLVLALDVANGVDLDAALREHGRIMHDAVIIDITTGNPGKLAEIEWSDKSASSVSEMIARLLYRIDGKTKIGKEESTAFLTGIVAATNRFSNARTTPATMRMASRLMESGANQQLIARNITPDIENEIFSIGGMTDEPREEVVNLNDSTKLDVQHGNEEGVDESKVVDTTVTEKESTLLDDLKAAEASLAAAGAETTPVDDDKPLKIDSSDMDVPPEGADNVENDELLPDTIGESVSEAPLVSEEKEKPQDTEEDKSSEEEATKEDTAEEAASEEDAVKEDVPEGEASEKETLSEESDKGDAAKEAESTESASSEDATGEDASAKEDEAKEDTSAKEDASAATSALEGESAGEEEKSTANEGFISEKPEKVLQPSSNMAGMGTSLDGEAEKYGHMLEDALASVSDELTASAAAGNLEGAPADGSAAGGVPVDSSAAEVAPAAEGTSVDGSVAEVAPGPNPAAESAPAVPTAPEVNGVPEMNYAPAPGQDVLPPPPPPPVNMDVPGVPGADGVAVPTDVPTPAAAPVAVPVAAPAAAPVAPAMPAAAAAPVAPAVPVVQPIAPAVPVEHPEPAPPEPQTVLQDQVYAPQAADPAAFKIPGT